MDSSKDSSAGLPLAGIGNAAEWLWRAADLKNLRASFGSSGEFGQTGAEKEIAAQAVAFVVNSSRKGIVSLCADVANLLRTRRSLEEKLMAREGDVISPSSGEATAAPYGSWTMCSNSSSSSSAAAAAAPPAAAAAAAVTSAVGCSPSCKHHRVSRASSSNSGGSGSGCCCHSACCTKDLAATEGGNAGATKDAARDDCRVPGCRHGKDRPLLCRQASLELNSPGSNGCNRSDSRDALTRCDAILSESTDGPADVSCRPECVTDKRSGTHVHSQSGDMLQPAGRCDGDGQPAEVTCGSGIDCCCCLLEQGPRLPDFGAACQLSGNSCCTSEDESIPNPSSLSRRKSRGVQVSLPMPHALNSVATRCSSCRACENRLSNALQANRKLLTQLAAAQRELILLQEKLCRYSSGMRNQAREPSQNCSNTPADTSIAAGKTSPSYSPPATTERNQSVSHSRSTSQISDDAVQSPAAANDPRDRSPMSSFSPTVEYRNGRLLTSLKSTAEGGRTALPESSTAGIADSGASADMAGSADSRSTAAAAAVHASAASGALGKLRRLIKGVSVGGTIILAEPRCKTVKLGDEVVTKLDRRGIVRYIGTLSDVPIESPTIYVGLQLHEPVGTNDGTYEGRRFFSCEQNHGLFVALHDVKSIVKKKKLVLIHRRGGSSDAGSSRSEDLSTAAGTIRSTALPQDRSVTTTALSAGNSPRSPHVKYERRATLPTLPKWSSSVSSHRQPSDMENASTV